MEIHLIWAQENNGGIGKNGQLPWHIPEDLKNKYAIQGNLSPHVLLGSDELIWNETQKICTIMNEYPGFIFNLGHGITPDIKPEKVKVMIDAIRE